MSNVIKAYSIRYNEQEKHIVDMNARAEEKIREYQELFQIKKDSEDEKPKASTDGFIQGLVAATIEPQEETEVISDETRMARLDQERQLQNKSIEQVNDKAQEIIEEAKQQVTSMLDQAKIDAHNLALEIEDQARRDGYQKGQQQAMAELNKERKKLEEEKQKLQREYEKKIKKFEPVFANLLISYIKRFTGVLMDEKRDIIMYLIDQELMCIDSSNLYLIHVSKDDFEIVNSQKSEIEWRVNENAQIEIIEDHILTRGQCLIETDSRIIDCSLDVQLKNLIGDIKLLAGSRNE